MTCALIMELEPRETVYHPYSTSVQCPCHYGVIMVSLHPAVVSQEIMTVKHEPQLLILTVCFLYGLNKADMVIRELKHVGRGVLVNFGESQVH